MADVDLEADLDAVDAAVHRLVEELSEVEDPDVRALLARVFAHVEAARRGIADLEAHLERVYARGDEAGQGRG